MRNPFSIRNIDRILSRGFFKQIGVLLFLVAAIYGIMLAIITLIGVKPVELVSDSNLYSTQNAPYIIINRDSLQTVDTLFINEPDFEQTAKLKESGEYEQSDPALWWSVIYHFMDPGNQHMTSTLRGRWLSWIMALFGSFLMTGLLVSTMSNIIERRIDKYKKGLVHYKHNNHIVIIGSHEMVPDLIKQLHKKHPKCDIVVQTSHDVDELRTSLLSVLAKEETERFYLLYAKRDSKHELKHLWLHKAKELYLLGESEESDSVENYHDTLNMECLQNIADELEREAQPISKLRCHVMFEYQTTFSVFQFSDLSEEIKNHIEFLPFNLYESWAQKVLVHNRACISDGNKSINYKPLDDTGIGYDSPKQVHLVIVGMSKAGIALAIEASHITHYPNYLRDSSCKTRITFIDQNASEEKEFFMGRFKEMFSLCSWRYIDAGEYDAEDGCKNSDGKTMEMKEWHHPLFDSNSTSPYRYMAQLYQLKDEFIDIEYEFINGSAESPVIQNYLEESSLNTKRILTVAFCFNQANKAIASAIYLPHKVYENALQILVNQRQSATIIRNISENGNNAKRYQNIRPFGMLSDCYNLINDELRPAKLINYAYGGKSLCDGAIDEKVLEEKWNKLSVALKWSNIYSIESIPTKLRSIHYNKERGMDAREIELLAEVEHNRWNVEKLLMGFRPLTKEEEKVFVTFSKNRTNSDEDKKAFKAEQKRLKETLMAHYDIVPYNQLLTVDKDYDAAIVEALPYIAEAMD